MDEKRQKRGRIEREVESERRKAGEAQGKNEPSNPNFIQKIVSSLLLQASIYRIWRWRKKRERTRRLNFPRMSGYKICRIFFVFYV